MPPTLTNEIITAAIDGYELQKERIDSKIAELRSLLPDGSAATAAAPEPAKGKRRTMSAAARKRIGEAQRKRWAASKGKSEPAPGPVKSRRKLSAAGKKAIIAANKNGGHYNGLKLRRNRHRQIQAVNAIEQVPQP